MEEKNKLKTLGSKGFVCRKCTFFLDVGMGFDGDVNAFAKIDMGRCETLQQTSKTAKKKI